MRFAGWSVRPNVGRMKQAFVVLILLSTANLAWADRGLYTSELAELATLIGVWRADDIAADGENLRLMRPYITLKGDFESLSEVDTYSPRLANAMQRVRTEGPFILFITEAHERVDLVGDGILHHSFTIPVALKAVEGVINQLELKEKWETLSVREQIERSDLIVSGRLVDEHYPLFIVCPRSYVISVDKIYRGVPSERLAILPVPDEQLNIDSLIFVQRYIGDGPAYMVMHSVPLKDADVYLKNLSEISIPR